MTTTEATTDVEYLKALMETDRNVARIQAKTLAEAEATAKKAAEKAGTEVPATPVLDWMGSADYANRRDADGRSTGAGKTGRPRGTEIPQDAVWYYNGNPIKRTRPYGFGYLAQQHGSGIDGPGPITSERMREVITALGVTDLTASWDVVLPNGHRISLVLPGDRLPAKAPAGAAPAAPAKKAPAVKKPAAKKAPASKATAKKAPAAKKPATPRAGRPTAKASKVA